MADVIQPGGSENLTAVYTWSNGTTTPATDAVWAIDRVDAATLVANGATATETAIDLVNGELVATQVTASGAGFTSAPFEVDVQMSSAPTITGIEVSGAPA